MRYFFAFMVAGIFMLSLLNVSAQGYGYGHRDKDMSRDRIRNKLHEKLDLTEEQKTKIEELRINHQKQMIEFRAELEKNMLGLRELKNKGEYTREEYIEKTKELGDIRDSMQMARANHHMDIYELLDPEQKITWNNSGGDFQGHNKRLRHHINRHQF